MRTVTERQGPSTGSPLAAGAIAVLLAMAWGAGTTRAKTVYVEGTNGATGNSGLAPDEALLTITEGAGLLEPGDEMIIGPGVYYEQPEFYVPGANEDAPVWIRAHPLGSATISGMWQEAAEGSATWQPTQWEGIYAAEHEGAVFGTHDGVFLWRYNDVDDLAAGSVQFVATGTHGTSVVLDLPDYGIAADETHLYLKLPGGIDPNGESVLLSSGAEGETETLTLVWVSSSPYVILDGLRIQGSGRHGIWFDGDSVSPTIRNTVFEHCANGVRLPDGSLVEWSEYGYPGLYEFAEQVYAANPDHDPDAIYHLIKEYQTYEETEPTMLDGCMASSFWQVAPSVGCEFRYNLVHEAFDGEKLGLFDDSESHHSVYMYNYDNHMEFEAWPESFHTENLAMHHSLLLACPGGAVGHQGDNIVGPHYVYRNVIDGYDHVGLDGWTQIKSYADGATGGMYYYNNVVRAGSGLLFWLSREHLVFRNNIFVFDDLEDVEDPNVPLDSDYNLLVNLDDEPWIRGADHGIYLGDDPEDVGFIDYLQLDYGLQADSPAIDQGQLIPGFTDDVADGMPDLGAFEFGEIPGTDWPRPRVTTYTCDPPGRWNGDVPEDYCGDDDVADDDDSSETDDDDSGETDDDDTAGTSDDDDSAPGADEMDDAGGCGCEDGMMQRGAGVSPAWLGIAGVYVLVRRRTSLQPDGVAGPTETQRATISTSSSIGAPSHQSSS